MKKVKDFNYISSKKYDGMMGRCYRTTDKSYNRYGGRGIKVTEEWIKDINSFRLWLLNEINRLGIDLTQFVTNPGKYQLDRINSDGHYTTTNCRLVSVQQNSRNKFKNKETIVSAEGNIISLKGETSNELAVKINRAIIVNDKLRTAS